MDTVVHAAFFTTPRRDAAYSHELESIGTLHLAAAAAAAGVRHLVLRSFTAVYGARGQNPNFLTEDQPPRRPRAARLGAGQGRGRGARVLLRQALSRARGHGPALRDAARARASTPSTPASSASGWCPWSWATTRSCSSCTPTTRCDAVDAALARAPGGVVNVVPRGTMSLLTALHLAGQADRRRCPHLVAYPVADLWWAAGVGEAPGGFVDYVRYLFVADGEKARRELGFEARHTQPRRAHGLPRVPLSRTRPAARGQQRRREEREEADVPGGAGVERREQGRPDRSARAAPAHAGARRRTRSRRRLAELERELARRAPREEHEGARS